MEYIEAFRKRLQLHGDTHQSKIENRLQNDFDHFRSRSPDRVEILTRGETYEAVLQTELRTVQQSEKKIVQTLMTDKTLLLNEGEIFSIEDKDFHEFLTWIILNREERVFKGYFRYKVLLMEKELSYIDKNGVRRKVLAHIAGSTESHIKEYFKLTNDMSTEVNGKKIGVVWQANPDIDEDTKFFLGDEVWRYVDSDKISVPGVYYTTLKQVPKNEYKDDEESLTANEDSENSVSIMSSRGDIINAQIGKDKFTFFALEDGLLDKTPEFKYIFNNRAFTQEGDTFTIKSLAPSTILVERGVLKKNFKVIGSNTPSNEIDVIGGDVVRKGIPSKIRISSALDWNVAFDSHRISVEKHLDFIIVTGVEVGNTIIKISNGIKEREIPITVENMWAR